MTKGRDIPAPRDGRAMGTRKGDACMINVIKIGNGRYLVRLDERALLAAGWARPEDWICRILEKAVPQDNDADLDDEVPF